MRILMIGDIVGRPGRKAAAALLPQITREHKVDFVMANGENAEQVLQEFSHRLTQKLLHPTSILLREAAKVEDPAYFEMLQEGLQDVVAKRRKAKH